MKLFPKEVDFYEVFIKMAQNANRATSMLLDLLKNMDRIEDRVEEIYGVEQEGDMLTHDVIKRLNRTFLTPIDREDIHALATRIDDIVDRVWAVADRIKVFRVTSATESAISICRDLDRTTQVLNKAIIALQAKQYDHVQEHCIEINRLENRIDRDFKAALGSLFENEKDPVMIIKWKDLYENLEKAANRCEDVANILEAVLLKNA